jgi:hypothetical protein
MPSVTGAAKTDKNMDFKSASVTGAAKIEKLDLKNARCDRSS